MPTLAFGIKGEASSARSSRAGPHFSLLTHPLSRHPDASSRSSSLPHLGPHRALARVYRLLVESPPMPGNARSSLSTSSFRGRAKVTPTQCPEQFSSSEFHGWPTAFAGWTSSRGV